MGCTIETWAKVYGYIHAISAALVVLFIAAFNVETVVGLFMNKMINSREFDPNNTEDMLRTRASTEIICWTMVIIGMTVSILALVFSSLLLNGIYKRKPAHVLSYFIFGVVFIVINAIGNLGLLIMGTPGAATGFLHIVIGALILWFVIWRTYKKIQLESKQVLFSSQMSGLENPLVPAYQAAYTVKC